MHIRNPLLRFVLALLHFDWNVLVWYFEFLASDEDGDVEAIDLRDHLRSGCQWVGLGLRAQLFRGDEGNAGRYSRTTKRALLNGEEFQLRNSYVSLST